MPTLEDRRRALRATILLRDGRYSVPDRLHGTILDILCATRRHDVAQRAAKVAVMILRYHASPRHMHRRPVFFLRLRGVARKLGLTKAHMETILRKLEGRLVERIIDETFGKERWLDGGWRNKATKWRFVHRVAMTLAGIHDRSKAERAAVAKELKSNSDKYTIFRVAFLRTRCRLSALYHSRKHENANRASLSELGIKMPAHDPPGPIICKHAPDRSWTPVKRVVGAVCEAVLEVRCSHITTHRLDRCSNPWR